MNKLFKNMKLQPISELFQILGAISLIEHFQKGGTIEVLVVLIVVFVVANITSWSFNLIEFLLKKGYNYIKGNNVKK
jgi:hypothetical protein